MCTPDTMHQKVSILHVESRPRMSMNYRFLSSRSSVQSAQVIKCRRPLFIPEILFSLVRPLVPHWETSFISPTMLKQAPSNHCLQGITGCRSASLSHTELHLFRRSGRSSRSSPLTRIYQSCRHLVQQQELCSSLRKGEMYLRTSSVP